MPPPSLLARLPLIVTLVSFVAVASSLYSPPPFFARLPASVTFSSVTVPFLTYRPPPSLSSALLSRISTSRASSVAPLSL